GQANNARGGERQQASGQNGGPARPAYLSRHSDGGDVAAGAARDGGIASLARCGRQFATVMLQCRLCRSEMDQLDPQRFIALGPNRKTQSSNSKFGACGSAATRSAQD